MMILPVSSSEYSGRTAQVKFTNKNTIPPANTNTEINEISTKKKLTIGGVVAAGTTALLGLVSKFRKPSSMSAKQLTKQTQNLIKKLQPQNKELAQEMFPLFITHAEKLGIVEQDFNKLLTGINEQNKDFMIAEGISSISGKMENLKEFITSPTEDIVTLFETLTKKNKHIFERITQTPKDFKVEDIDDIAMYLTDLKPKNNEYMFDELFPMLKQYEEPLKLNMASQYVKLLNKFTKSTQNVVQTVAEADNFRNKNINRYNILINVNDQNYTCVTPIIQNSNKLKDTENEIIQLLRTFNNSNAHSIKPILRNLENLNELKIKIPEILKFLKVEEDSKIFDMVMKDPKLYNIAELSEIKPYLKDLKGKDLKFLSETVEPKIRQYKELYRLTCPDHISEIMSTMTPETVQSFDDIAKYTDKLGNNISYQALLHALTKDNIKNLEQFLKNVRKTELWGDTMVWAGDYKPYLDGIKEL